MELFTKANLTPEAEKLICDDFVYAIAEQAVRDIQKYDCWMTRFFKKDRKSLKSYSEFKKLNALVRDAKTARQFLIGTKYYDMLLKEETAKKRCHPIIFGESLLKEYRNKHMRNGKFEEE